MLLNAILIIIFFIAESEKDIIMTNSKLSLFPKWKWYNRHDYTGKSWWIENVISFIGDGFHFWKAISILIPSYYLTELAFDNGWYSILLFIIAGIYHSIRNGSLTRKNLKL